MITFAEAKASQLESGAKNLPNIAKHTVGHRWKARLLIEGKVFEKYFLNEEDAWNYVQSIRRVSH